VIALGLITCCNAKGSLIVIFQRETKEVIYIQHELQVDFQSTWSSYRYTGIISDVAASFLSNNSLISPHFSQPKVVVVKSLHPGRRREFAAHIALTLLIFATRYIL
jgi:hypothetical protein